jgi:hypothetical protein
VEGLLGVVSMLALLTRFLIVLFCFVITREELMRLVLYAIGVIVVFSVWKVPTCYCFFIFKCNTPVDFMYF